MRDLRRAATDGPRFRRGTVRTPESVPGCSIEVPEVSASTFAGTVRAERTRPAESAANGFASGIECGAIFPSGLRCASAVPARQYNPSAMVDFGLDGRCVLIEPLLLSSHTPNPPSSGVRPRASAPGVVPANRRASRFRCD
jgi:hypothetical protein